MSPALRHVTLERRPHGLAIVETKTREVLEVVPEAVAERRARAWDRVFHGDGERESEPAAPALVTSRGAPLADAPSSRVRGAAPTKPKRVREFRAGLRDPRDRAGKWMPLVFESPDDGVPAGATCHLTQFPQFAWRGEFLRVDRACAPHFRISNVMIGHCAQTVSVASDMPATLFAQTRRWFRWTFDVADPGRTVTLRVRNVSDKPRRFDAVVLGREITRIELTPQIPFRGDHLVADPSRDGYPEWVASPYGRRFVDTASGFRQASEYDDGKGSKR